MLKCFSAKKTKSTSYYLLGVIASSTQGYSEEQTYLAANYLGPFNLQLDYDV